MEIPKHEPRWYALHVRPRFEKMVERHLSARGFETFVPLYRGRHRWSDRVKEVQVPLFPGYVFCRFDVHHRLPILMIPGVQSVVGNGKLPCPIDDTQLNDIRCAISSGLNCEPWPFPMVGQIVEVDRGALAGVRGTIVTFKKCHRLVLSVNVLQRAVAVEIDGECVRPVITDDALALT